ncbi:SPOR domain-containing protein [Sphingomicrobium sp. XHP0239]|uniref:SPOR domain-containing protein n=1 Tax=Sphingomicrobium maritimum TaxID=3133972 RepID=UPI0031CC7DE2
MADIADEDRLPWLQEVEDDDSSGAISATKIAIGAAIVIALLAAVAGTTFWLGRDATTGTATGEPELIAAPNTPYKIRPDDPGGLDLSEDSGTAFATSAGEDPDARLDTERLGEQAPRIEVEEPASEPATPATPEPGAAPPALVQLGAYSSRAKAETGWALLSSRFPEVAALDKRIVAATVNGQQLYRLRAGAPDAAAARSACAALDAAGESCVIVN